MSEGILSRCRFCGTDLSGLGPGSWTHYCSAVVGPDDPAAAIRREERERAARITEKHVGVFHYEHPDEWSCYGCDWQGMGHTEHLAALIREGAE